MARMIAVNARDSERFTRLFNAGPSSSDRPRSLPVSGWSGGDAVTSAHDPHAPVRGLRPEDVNCGIRGEQQKQELMTLLDDFIGRGLFPVDPKRFPICLDGELSLPIVDASHAPVAAKQRRFSPEETQTIRQEVDKLFERGIIRPSKSSILCGYVWASGDSTACSC